MAAIQSVGFPMSYPYGISQPLPSAILRPLQQPLYDTEVLVNAAVSEQIFFQRQLGQTMANYATYTKTEAETNLQQPGQLANPLEFSVFGFLFEVMPGITLADFLAVYTSGLFIFTYTGNRVYLQIPLMRIPQGVSPEGFAGGTLATGSQVVHNGVGHVSNMYKFTIGRAALRIRPTESFQIKLKWSGTTAGTSSITLSTAIPGTRLRVYIIGLTWTAL